MAEAWGTVWLVWILALGGSGLTLGILVVLTMSAPVTLRLAAAGLVLLAVVFAVGLNVIGLIPPPFSLLGMLLMPVLAAIGLRHLWADDAPPGPAAHPSPSDAREEGMSGPMCWVLRFLSGCHFAWGGVLLLGTGWSSWSMFRTLPHLSTGPLWANLPYALLLVAAPALPPAVLGVWMGVMGRRLWSPEARLRAPLLWTHGSFLVIGSVAVYIGIQSVGAAEISTWRGGGLLSPLAWIPLVFGLPTVVLAAFSLCAAFLAFPTSRASGRQQEASLYGPSAGDSRPFLRLMLAWILLSWGFSILIPAIWPASEAQEAATQTEQAIARRKADIDALRALARRPPDETAAVLRSAILDGRLDVMRLTDQHATLALVTANLPVAFECIDILEAKNRSVMADIEKQGAIRSWADREREDVHLRLTNSMSGLLALLNDVKQVPASQEQLLAQRGARKGPGQAAAISLVGKLDIPTDRRIGLLISFVTAEDRQAASAARQALAQLGAQAGSARDELKQLQAARQDHPPTGTPSPLDDQPTPKLPGQKTSEAAGGTSGNQTAYAQSTERDGETMFLLFTDNLDQSEVVAVSNPSQAHILVDIGLGLWQPRFMLQWSVFVDYGQIKVEQQMETSLSISGRGPHLDLLEWKHHYSAWKELKRIGRGRWQSASFASEELTSFPPFTIDEVKDQVRKQLKDFPEGLDHWLKLAETCTPPFDQACAIGASRAVIRMSIKKGADWIEIKRIEIQIPMGC